MRGKVAKLTDKQKRFVDEYLLDLNATQAAIRAGYSAKTADRIGPELLGKTCVSDAIQAAILARQERTEITQDKVLEELGKVAFEEASDRKGSELRYSSKLRALELVGKHLGMFNMKYKIEPADDSSGGVIIMPAVLTDDQAGAAVEARGTQEDGKADGVIFLPEILTE